MSCSPRPQPPPHGSAEALQVRAALLELLSDDLALALELIVEADDERGSLRSLVGYTRQVVPSRMKRAKPVEQLVLPTPEAAPSAPPIPTHRRASRRRASWGSATLLFAAPAVQLLPLPLRIWGAQCENHGTNYRQRVIILHSSPSLHHRFPVQFQRRRCHVVPQSLKLGRAIGV